MYFVSFAIFVAACFLGFPCFAEIPAPPKTVPLVMQFSPTVRAQFSEEQLKTLDALTDQLAQQVSIYSGFEIQLPEPHLQDGPRLVDLRAKFDLNTPERLQRLAFHADGERRVLTEAEKAQFQFDSTFLNEDPAAAGSYDLWTVRWKFAHKGESAIRATFQTDMASGLRRLFVEVPESLVGHTRSSVLVSLKNIALGARSTLSKLVGLPESKRKYSAEEVRTLLLQERAEFIGGANVYPQEDLVEEEVDTHSQMDPFVWPADAILANRAVIEKAEPILAKLWNQTDSDKRFSTAGSGSFATAVRGRKQIHFLSLIEQNPELENIYPGLGLEIAKHAAVLGMLEEAKYELAERVAQRKADFETTLRAQYPIRSRIPEWVEARVEADAQEYFEKLRDSRLDQLALRLRTAEGGRFKEFAGFIESAMLFTQEVEAGVKRDLEKEKVPASSHTVTSRIWRLKNWVVTKSVNAEGETVYTGGPYKSFAEVHSNTYFWRLKIALQRSYSAFKEMGHFAFYRHLWAGPLGIRSLVEANPFPFTFMVDPETGNIIENPHRSQMGTLLSRFVEIQSNLTQVREEFKNRPDTAEFSKWLLNYPHAFWHGLVRRIAEPLFVNGAQLLGFYGVNIALPYYLGTHYPVETLSVLAALPFVYGFFPQASELAKESPKILHQLGPKGVFSAFYQGLKGIAWNGLTVPLAHWLKGVSHFWVSTSRDFLVRNLLFSLQPNMPGQSPSYFFQRIQGPGAEGGYVFEISQAIALTALVAKLELTELEQHRSVVARLLNQPEREVEKFFAPVFQLTQGHPSATFDDGNPLVERARLFAQAQLKELDELISERKHVLDRALPESPAPAAFKLPKADLEQAVSKGIRLTRAFFEKGVFEQMIPEEIAEFWRSRSLEEGDWSGLTTLMLAQVFGEGVLTPITTEEKKFSAQLSTPNTNTRSIPRSELTWTVERSRSSAPELRAVTSQEICSSWLAAYGEGWGRYQDLGYQPSAPRPGKVLPKPRRSRGWFSGLVD